MKCWEIGYHSGYLLEHLLVHNPVTSTPRFGNHSPIQRNGSGSHVGAMWLLFTPKFQTQLIRFGSISHYFKPLTFLCIWDWKIFWFNVRLSIDWKAPWKGNYFYFIPNILHVRKQSSTTGSDSFVPVILHLLSNFLTPVLLFKSHGYSHFTDEKLRLKEIKYFAQECMSERSRDRSASHIANHSAMYSASMWQVVNKYLSMNEGMESFLVLVLAGPAGLHRIIQLQLLWH